jgi:tetratricopeptide (TPR) repeat protein
MTTPAIDKLLKKLEKEPNSLIFLQLAEEYRKESYYDDALFVCQEGLKRHPNYWSARVALGRIHKEMGHSDLAKAELEKVIKAVPDNLLANKLLGDIYMEMNLDQEALKRYQLVQMLTPSDTEVINNIHKLENRITGITAPVAPPIEINNQAEEDSMPATTVEMLVPKNTSEIKTEEFPQLTFQRDLPPFTDDLPGFVEKTAPGTSPAIFQEFMDSTIATAAEEPTLIEPMPEFFKQARSYTEEATRNDEFDFPEIDPAPTKVDQTQPMEDGEADELTTQTLAELYVQQGLIDKATKVYQKLLLNDPGNTEIIQRLKDLNPADALLAAAAAQEQKLRAAASKPKTFDLSNSNSPRPQDRLSEERRRKISTLENWLAAIRRERL